MDKIESSLDFFHHGTPHVFEESLNNGAVLAAEVIRLRSELSRTKEKMGKMEDHLDRYAKCDYDCQSRTAGNSWEDCSCGLRDLLEHGLPDAAMRATVARIRDLEREMEKKDSMLRRIRQWIDCLNPSEVRVPLSIDEDLDAALALRVDAGEMK